MMRRIRDPRMLSAAIVAGFAMVVLALAFVWRAHDQERLRNLAQMNCEQIEALKKVVRPEPFDVARIRRLLTDLSIDPDSERGRRLLNEAQRTNARERRELAPNEC